MCVLKGIPTRIEKYILGLCGFDANGCSKRIPVKQGKALPDGPKKGEKLREIFPWSSANWWRDAVAEVLSRNTELSKTDAISYKYVCP